MFRSTIVGRAGPAAKVASRSCIRGASMPLRAKVLGWQLPNSSQMSTTADSSGTDSDNGGRERLEAVRELPGDDPTDVVFSSVYGLRTIQLNRPKKLNSLNASMIRKIVPRLREWEKSDLANVVVIKGAGDKAFCAGGDVTALADYNKEGKWQDSADYFAKEYRLDHYIGTYQKPYIAFMDGITMGGGVGLSVHAPFRIATERTVFAMPETTIGFFPDVGASFFLPKMNGAVGTYLALTSERLTGANVFYSGIATHYLHSTSLNALESRLAELRFKDYDNLSTRLNLINETLEEYVTGLPHDQPMLLAGELRQAVDRCFGHATVEDIIKALEAEKGSTEDWARKTIETLHKRSPTSVHVSLRQMLAAKNWTLQEAFREEFKIATAFMKGGEFTEGVSALLVRKEKPKWQPATLEDIKPEHNITEPFFDPQARKDPLQFFNDRDCSKYPFWKLGIPTEEEMREIVRSGQFTPEEVQYAVCAERKNRQGVAEIVGEIISRKVRAGENGKAVWLDK